MAKILVTGGLGFIGSHTVVELQEDGHEVVIIDDLSNASIDILNRIESITRVKPEFFQLDLKDEDALREFFQDHSNIDGVIHFAAKKSVSESVSDPLAYYENNIHGLVYLLKELKYHSISNFIFSSSCTVYGETESLPISEDAAVQEARSPYGNTKQIGEEILRDLCHVSPDFSCISLRYFNPIGAHPSAKIGELPLGVPQNLVPYITQTAVGIRDELLIFGNDYPTKDGTCIRDFIHVVDLAKAHMVALKRLINGSNQSNYEIFNLGTGTGSTVMEVVESFERVSGEKLNYKFAARRQGDVMAAYADTSRANSVLGWKAELSLDDAMLSAWKWEQHLRKTN